MPALENAKHETVVQKYVADPERIGWRAYQTVYPQSSKRAAETAFSRLLKIAVFAARIAELDEKAADDGAVLSAREVLIGLSQLAAANMQDFMSIDGFGQPRLDWSKLTRAQAAALAEVTVEEYVDGSAGDAKEDQAHGGSLRRGIGWPVRRVKFRLCDKHAALVSLGKHYKLFVERRQHEDPDGRPAGTAAAEKMSPYEVARRIMFALELGAREGQNEKTAAASERPAVPAGANCPQAHQKRAGKRVSDAAAQRSRSSRRDRLARPRNGKRKSK